MSENALATSAPSASIGFLSLPVELRDIIYKQVLILLRPVYLFQDRGGPLGSFIPGKPSQWRALLYVSRQISDEARVVLYSSNQFNIQEVPTKYDQGRVLRSFLDCIGPTNTRLLSRLCVNFPATEKVEGQEGKIRLREDALQWLQLLQRECPNLKTLETLVYSNDSSELIEERDSTQLVRDVLLGIDGQFRAIASLDRIIVRVTSGTPSPSVKEFLQGLGWAVFGRGQ
ncbi:hypothetical protein FQN54_005279 [Arachnomyces sp. PD_36]|nr:hypothetical protein FQN54_005279 [Arachnomyces sp. PD_36]